MKKSILTILVTTLFATLLATGLLVGCGSLVTGSGNLETETFNFSDFTKIEAHNGFQVELTKSRTYSIEITTDDNVQEYIEVTKSGDKLRIRLTGFRNYSSVTLEAKITMPDIYGINLSGGSQADVTGFSSSHDFSAALSGGSGLTGNITIGDADFDLSEFRRNLVSSTFVLGIFIAAHSGLLCNNKKMFCYPSHRGCSVLYY